MSDDHKSASASESVKYVDHTYRDYSTYLQNGGQLIKHKKSDKNFPVKMHRILSNPMYSHIITWMPHGRAFKILKREELIRDVIPGFFVCSKYESFTRQLTAWNFKRLYASGPDEGCYYHEAFLRGMPELTCFIRRLPQNVGKSTKYPQGEPDFYRISAHYPVPPPNRMVPGGFQFPLAPGAPPGAAPGGAPGQDTPPQPFSPTAGGYPSGMPPGHPPPGAPTGHPPQGFPPQPPGYPPQGYPPYPPYGYPPQGQYPGYPPHYPPYGQPPYWPGHPGAQQPPDAAEAPSAAAPAGTAATSETPADDVPAAPSQQEEASDKAEVGDADGSAPAAAKSNGVKKEDPDVESAKKDEVIAKNEATETESTVVEAEEPAEV
mmetsp:Transcript_32826/g.73820  ORF Transcript_32826/g.73820 Transcript_32826/m.73820 type:complete len:376 (+) Transcript_32826:105-1232(+)